MISSFKNIAAVGINDINFLKKVGILVWFYISISECESERNQRRTWHFFKIYLQIAILIDTAQRKFFMNQAIEKFCKPFILFVSLFLLFFYQLQRSILKALVFLVFQYVFLLFLILFLVYIKKESVLG